MQVVILCGGKGVRSYPFTEFFPKVLLPVGGRPILIHLMHIFARQGYREFILAAGHRQEALFDYFDGRFADWRVTILDTGAESDTGERIRRCAPYLQGRFFATYGDGIGDVDLAELARFHEQCGGLATLTSVPLRSQYGMVAFNENKRVSGFREKPFIDNCWINAGFFVFDQQVFQYWNGQNLESDVLPSLAAQRVLYAYQHRGFWRSLDTFKDQAEIDCLLQNERIRTAEMRSCENNSAIAAIGGRP